jgi:hypothetical protein
MKPISLLLALTFALAATSGAWAADQAKNAKPAKGAAARETKNVKSSAPQKEQQVALTGSYIKRDIRRNGIVTDGPNPVYLLDRQSIEVSGGADLSQVLLRSGFRR